MTKTGSQQNHAVTMSPGSARPHLAILSLFASPAQELQQGKQEPDTKSQAKKEEEAPQVMGLQGLGGVVGAVACTAAGPPLVLQVL